ncbi:uncharacterized protein LOC121732507 isoform X2 [Aricia agestis]|uniref:uncharacterized protein LOC121732507 isoform X2 n=1 Tax=Aricia agestis TaxID=91739 RepID=UPI001C20BDE7|nr:uncharacterized protein LOC121732507 isoform X2 [Aricia agestis]
MEEREVFYEDERNSMLASDVDSEIENEVELYDDMAISIRNLPSEYSMDILFFGPPEAFLRLDAESVLHILTYTRKEYIPLSRVLLAWDLVTDGKTSAYLQRRELQAFGKLLDHIPEQDLFYINMGVESVFRYFSNNKVDVNDRTFGIIIAAFRRYFGEEAYKDPQYTNELGYLLCGFPVKDLRKIPPKVFKDIASENLKKLDRCSIEQLKTLYSIAIDSEAYGSPYVWSAYELAKLDRLINCIPRKHIGYLKLEAIPAIRPQVMEKIDQKLLAYFSDAQISRMNSKSRRVYNMPSVRHYSTSEVNQYELSSRLLSLTENNKSYTLTQINGQRIYRKAPHAWNGPEPSRNCEVFIGRIPHDCFEDTLVPLFSRAGDLFEFRLMINFSGWNRGYAFAMYTTEAEASNAIQMFNNYMIRPSWQLGVCPSINNCRIFVSRIPPSTSSAEIVRLLYALTDEVHEVRIRRSVASVAAIVEYKSHRGAAMARKALVAAASAAWGGGARPAVDWSLPQSPQLLRQYREIGRWSPERGVELTRTGGEAESGASLALERWSAARRLRMIHEAQRQRPREQWSDQMHSMESLMASMSTLNVAASVWGEPAAPAQPAPPAPPAFNPWTSRHPLEEFMASRDVFALLVW